MANRSPFATDTGDEIAVTFSRAVTRRGFLQKTMRWTYAFAAAASTGLFFPRFASADPSCKYGVDHSTCYCANTMGCGSSNCNGTSCVGTAAERCNSWNGLGGPHCWCSETCCLGNKINKGYFSCCDCWKIAGTDCLHGTTPCICSVRVLTGPC